MGQKPTKITGQWADKPFSLIETPMKREGVNDCANTKGANTNAVQITDHNKVPGALFAATDMALVHNCFIRILNCIYLQAPNVKKEKDIEDFVFFMHGLVLSLHEHHSNEEEFFFVWLEDYIGIKNYMEKNVEQHQAFAAPLLAFEIYVKALMDKKETYDAAKVLSLIDGFGPILTTHLTDEIASFESLETFGDKIDWKAWHKRVGETAVKTAETVRRFTLDALIFANPLKGIHDPHCVNKHGPVVREGSS